METPSRWVRRFLAGVRPGGHVLDVACGGGRHMRLALAMGHPVTGVDRDLSRVADLAGRPGVTLIEADLERGRRVPFAGLRFDGVIATHYLWRPVLAEIVACVAEDGVLIYETFARGNERYGKPTNPDFLLEPNELLTAALPGLVVVAYEHGLDADGRLRLVQRIAACGRRHAWAGAGPLRLGPDSPL